ncbi:hypothetical protein V866_003765 [Kwoniella sp. B9012]|uniref:Glycosyltransferase 61 catalytic domain-containing protein n=1 Tax=Kwoniella europaea PYCC6329 TaxID=1423913 RepID=A0AAX4KGL5_9TREE
MSWSNWVNPQSSNGSWEKFKSKRRNTNVLIISGCIFLFLISTYLYAQGIFQFDRNVVNEIRLDKPTQLVGGLPGFYVFEELWYRNGTFYAFREDVMDVPLPDKDKIISGPHDIITQSLSAQEELMNGNLGQIRYFNVFLNDGADQWNWSYLNWFYHLAAEALLGGIASLALSNDILEEDLPRLMIPWEGNWKDGYGINEGMIRAIFGKYLVEKDQWERWSVSRDWIGFEKVVIVDRYASHRHNPIANEWNKMSLPIFEELPSPPPPFFAPYRQKLLRNLHLSQPPVRAKVGKALDVIPKIVYLDRQETDRKLSDDDHTGLLEVLRNLKKDGKAEVGVPHLSEMGFRNQVKAVKGADIIIGIHGNGLTHQMWMPEGGIVIELFIPDAFLRDYQVLSQALGHRHIAIWNDRILPPSEWETIDGQLNPTIMHNGTLIPLNTSFIQTLLEDLLIGMS